jgi:hypothetical protein
MIKNNIWVRDFLIRQDQLIKLSEANQKQVLDLIKEFNGLNYIDFRTEIGPDQIRRMSKTQKEKLMKTASRVQEIELSLRRLFTPEKTLAINSINHEKKQLLQSVSSCESNLKFILSLGRMAYKKNGQLKISYQRTVDHRETEMFKALKNISKLNVKLLLLNQ